ncbi:glycosyltransferase [Rosenbergiella australiborealis]|uniref:glycosyltransferase n=1 Tax=Rosenbergiella australiborealis TaxID=1544696 RepID=UPI001F4D777B|nr:glycosyltransferase [Rosenbergiella australiborealis]
MFFGRELIKNKIEFSSLKSEEELNIAYGADNKFILGAGVSIESVIINNENKKLKFHLFTDDISSENIEKISQICKKYETAIDIYNVNAELIRTLPNNKAWNHAIYFRLMIADYFCGKVKKILYLDSDVFCNYGC